MVEVIVVAIWDKNPDKVLTRSILVSKDYKGIKVDGKKPNKLIVPESLTDRRVLRKVKDIGTYGCTIIKATGK
jgi:hypothetical protein